MTSTNMIFCRQLANTSHPCSEKFPISLMLTFLIMKRCRQASSRIHDIGLSCTVGPALGSLQSGAPHFSSYVSRSLPYGG
jgi:hypothetical protein